MTTKYISPLGSGDRSGASIANAAPIQNLNAMIQKAGAGGSVVILADVGTYEMASKSLVLTSGGTAAAPVTIRGEDRHGNETAARFIGDRAVGVAAATLKGTDLFVMSGGANNLKFENFTIENVENAFRVSADVSNLTIGEVTAKNVQRFFEDRQANDDPAKTATISGLTIHDVNVSGYSKNVIRLQFDTNNVRITDVVGDSAGQTFDDYAMGIHLDDTVHDVVLQRVTMLNNQNFTGSYWNGDGFATEGNTHHITFIDTVARGSTDGGYDLKSDYTTLIRTVADDNARNYRFWGHGNVMEAAVGLDPHSRNGGSNSQIWMKGGAELTIRNSEFIDAGYATKVFNYDDRATINLDNVRITYAEGAVLKFAAGTLSGLDADLVEIVEAVGPYSTDSVSSVGNHAPAGSVSVTGSLLEDAVLSASNTLSDRDGMGELQYQWLRDGAAISGATRQTYALGQADVGKALSVRASYVDGDGKYESGTSSARGPVANVNDAPQGAVTISGNASSGSILTASATLSDQDGLGAVSYQWLRDGAAIQGMTSASYSIQSSDIAHRLSVQASYTDGFGTKEKATSASVVPAVTTGSSSLTGTNSADTLSASSDANWTINGLGGADTLSGRGGADTLFGGAGNDRLLGHRGNDLVDGGAGHDTAVLTGGRRDYMFEVSDSMLIVTDKRTTGADGSDRLVAIESLDFSGSDLRPAGSIYSHSANQTLQGTSGDDIFFFDTAIGLALGQDTIKGFGKADILVTTSAFLDSNGDRIIRANQSDRFALASATEAEIGISTGNVKIFSDNSGVVSSLQLLFVEMHETVTYYAYGKLDAADFQPDLLF